MQNGRGARRRIRRAIILGHLWLGLVFGAIWSLQGLTGALLVFHRELDQPATADGAVTRPLDELIAAAAASKGQPPEAIGLYYADPALLAVTFSVPQQGKVSVLVEAANAQVVGERKRTPVTPAGGNMWRWLYNLHHGLLLGERGEILLGSSGLVLLSMAVTGIYLGLPRRRQWLRAFDARRWRTRLQQLFGWHRCVGLLASAALVLLTVSGALMDFGKPLRAWASGNAGLETPYKAAAGSPPPTMISAQAALRIAHAALPRAAFVSLTLPTPASPVYHVRLRTPGEWRSWSGTSIVTVAPADGRVIGRYDASRAPLANRILESAFAVHNGEVAGLFGRLLTMAAGLSLPVLYLSGLWAWLRKRRLRSVPQAGGSTVLLCQPRSQR